MSIYHRIEQRSADWFYRRVGKPTASEFHKIITPKRGDLSEQAGDYMRFMLAEMMLGKPIDTPDTEWMRRGQEVEDSAIDGYEFTTGEETDMGGFWTDDSGLIGASPDRIVGEDGLLEIKSPAPQTHMGYLLAPDSLRDAKRVQVQGQLLVTGRKWVDLVSFHPEMPVLVRRVKREEAFIEKMWASLNAFVRTLQDARLALERVYGPFPEVVAPKRVMDAVRSSDGRRKDTTTAAAHRPVPDGHAADGR